MSIKKFVALNLAVILWFSAAQANIMGYLGMSCCPFIKQGLTRFSRAQSDVPGFACMLSDDGTSFYMDVAPSAQQLVKKIEKHDGACGIGSVMTHAERSMKHTAHAHTNCDDSLAVVCDGVIKNGATIRQAFIDNEGCTFASTDDAEVLAHVAKTMLEKCASEQLAMAAVMQMVEGKYSCILMMQDRPDMLLAIRNGTPLYVGMGDGEYFVTSTPNLVNTRSAQLIAMSQESVAVITKHSVKFYGRDGQEIRQ